MPRETKGDCRKCGEFIGYFGTSSTKLIGDYTTHLCADCTNDWDVFIRDHPARRAFADTQTQIDMLTARTCGDGVDRYEEVTRLTEIYHQQRIALFDIAAAWVGERITA